MAQAKTVRRKLLHECDVHTLLRLPTGHLLRAGCQSQRTVLRSLCLAQPIPPGPEWLWIYELPYEHSCDTLKTNPLQRTDLDVFRVLAFMPENRFQRKGHLGCRVRTPMAAGERSTTEELLKRDKVSLDVFWLKDESSGGLGEPTPTPTSSPPRSPRFARSARTVRGHRRRSRAGPTRLAEALNHPWARLYLEQTLRRRTARVRQVQATPVCCSATLGWIAPRARTHFAPQRAACRSASSVEIRAI